MNRPRSTRNYVGKKVFVGIDVHKRTYSLAAVCEDVVVKSWRMVADPLKCIESIKRFFADAELFSVYEAGFSGYQLHRKLNLAGIENIVINPASLQKAANEHVKTDRVDAKKLANQLSKGLLKGIAVPSERRELCREVSRLRSQLVDHRMTVTLQIKSKLLYFGLVATDDDRSLSEKLIKELEAKEYPEELRYSLDLLFEQWRYYTDKIKDVEKRLRRQETDDVRTSKIYRSVPGVGLVTGRILANELGDLASRFKNERELFSYTGLTPSEYSSGDSIRRGKITRCGPPRIRWILTEAAWVCIRYDRSLRAVYERIKKKRGGKRAIVAVARRLIGRIRSCFVNDTEYVLVDL